MKKKILIGLTSLVFFFLLGSLVVIYYITNTTERMDRLILLHQVEILREDLIIELQQVQAKIVQNREKIASDMEPLVSHVQEMDRVLDSCLGCHHAPEPAKGIAGIRAMANDYKMAIGSLVTTSSNAARIKHLEHRARELGQELIAKTEGMAFTANVRLRQKTQETMSTIRKIRGALYGMVIIGSLLAVVIGFALARSLDAQIQRLLFAMHSVGNGDLQHPMVSDSNQKNEFQKLEKAFNAMIQDLQQLHRRDVQIAKLSAVGDLAANIAYEVNNPLTGVLSYTDLLLRTDEIPIDKKEHLKTIERETIRAREMLSSLLIFSRRAAPHMQKTVVEMVVQEALEQIKSQAQASNVRIALSCSSRLPAVTVDRDELRQVFVSLAKNAIISMSGGGTLTVACNKAENRQNPPTVAIEFTDTGYGIPEEHLEKIFDPFFSTRLDEQRTRFGLSTSYMIVQRYGGRIEVESRVGAGSRFRVLLPVTV